MDYSRYKDLKIRHVEPHILEIAMGEEGKLSTATARLHKELETTMVYVTHDQVEAMTLADRIVVFNAGRIEQVGTPMELYHHPANLFVAGFIGSPKMNFVEATLVSATPAEATVRLNDGATVRTAVDATSQAAGSRLTLGVRPEHVRLRADGRWRATVELVEPMGNHQVVWMKSGDQGFSAVVHDGRRITAGDTLAFDIDETLLSVFDAASELRLS